MVCVTAAVNGAQRPKNLNRHLLTASLYKLQAHKLQAADRLHPERRPDTRHCSKIFNRMYNVCASHKLCLAPSPVPGGPWMSTRGVPSSPARSAPICSMTSTGTGITTGTAGRVRSCGSTQLKHRPSGAHRSSPAGPKQLVPHRAQHSTTQQSTRYKQLYINQQPAMTATSQKHAIFLDKTFVHE